MQNSFIKRHNGPRENEVKDMLSWDDYHKEDRATRKKTGNTPLDPKYNHLDKLASHLAQLRQGEPIIKPVYDHSTGEFAPETLFKPTRIMIVEGLHPFYTQKLRENLDLTIFVDPIRDVKWKWKLLRDVEKRGHDKQAALEEIIAREKFFKLFIDIQKVYAEIVIRIEESRYPDSDIENPQVKLKMLDTDIPVAHIDMSFDLANFITSSQKYFSFEFGSGHFYGNRYNIITLDGQLSKKNVSKLQKQICAFTGLEKPEMFDNKQELINPSGVAQLLIAWRFLEKLNFVLDELTS